MTGNFWPSAMVAALFAVHPMHVESVAWVSERKDMLSGLFFVLTVGVYAEYVRGPFSAARYLLLITAFALGLMAKPLLVTLPLLLLLLDYWPLGRFPFRWPLVREKVPLLLLSAISCLVTLWAQREAWVAVNASLAPSSRVANALVSYVAYLGQSCWPMGLTLFYPHPAATLPIWKIILAGALLAGISAGVLAGRRRCPYALVGWLWYLGMLVPMIGLLQAGDAARADRHMYLPQIGLCIALTWGVAEVCRAWSWRRRLYGLTSASVLLLLMVGAWRQTSFWSDSETLWSRSLACTSSNKLAHVNLGSALAAQKRFDEAMAHYQKALEIDPTYSLAYNAMGFAWADRGRPDKAMAQYRKALAVNPGDPEAYRNLGKALDGGGRNDHAVALFRQAVAIKPEDAEGHNNLGAALGQSGSVDEAIRELELSAKDQSPLRRGPLQSGQGFGRLWAVRRGLGAVSTGRGHQAGLRQGPPQSRQPVDGAGPTG